MVYQIDKSRARLRENGISSRSMSMHMALLAGNITPTFFFHANITAALRVMEMPLPPSQLD
jgi:hypothetical protein